MIVDASASSLMFTGLGLVFDESSFSAFFALTANDEDNEVAALRSGLKLQPVIDTRITNVTDTATMP